jgi:hypothetical protein
MSDHFNKRRNIRQQTTAGYRAKPEQQRKKRESPGAAIQWTAIDLRVQQDTILDLHQHHQCQRDEHHLGEEIEICKFVRCVLHDQYGARNGIHPETQPQDWEKPDHRRQAQAWRKPEDPKIDSRTDANAKPHADGMEQQNGREREYRRRLADPGRESGVLQPLQKLNHDS